MHLRHTFMPGAIVLALMGLRCGGGDGTSSTRAASGTGSSGGSTANSSGGGALGGDGTSDGGPSGSSSGGDGGPGSGGPGSGGSGGGGGDGGGGNGANDGPLGAGSVSHGGGLTPAGLSAALGFPQMNGKQTFAIGLGGTAIDPFQGTFALGTQLRIYENYLAGEAGLSVDWQTWNPNGTYVNKVFDTAQKNGAVPMFTVYQIAAFDYATGGKGCLANQTCMTNWWSAYKNMLTHIATYDRPALVNIEPDLTGYAQGLATNNDPATVTVKVAAASSDCSGLPDDLVGFASCILRLRTSVAPKAYVGFNVSNWYGDQQAIDFMTKMGAGKGDLLVMQTLDRDVGCFEANGDGCTRTPKPTYWGDTDFTNYVASCKKYHQAFSLPLVWWQTPLGVPSSTPGKNPYAKYGYRDNRVPYFFGHVPALVDAGGIGAVFSAGKDQQADISTDITADGTHQFKKALTTYNAAPAPLN